MWNNLYTSFRSTVRCVSKLNHDDPETKLKSNDDEAYSCFRRFWVGNTSDKYLPMLNLNKISFSLIIFMDTEDVIQYISPES